MVKHIALLTIIIIASSVFAIERGKATQPEGNVSKCEQDIGIDTETLYNLHNIERQKLGLRPLAKNAKLVEAANCKAKAMVTSNCWAHACPQGSSVWRYVAESGHGTYNIGENLGNGTYDMQEIMKAWLNSPTHKQNILESSYNEIGIGYARGDYQGRKDNVVIVVYFAEGLDN